MTRAQQTVQAKIRVATEMVKALNGNTKRKIMGNDLAWWSEYLKVNQQYLSTLT